MKNNGKSYMESYTPDEHEAAWGDEELEIYCGEEDIDKEFDEVRDKND